MLKVDMRRTYLIARRDFIGYVKTWGFWISFLLPFIMIVFFVGLRVMDINVEPVRHETIVDDTGQHKAGLMQAYDKQLDAQKMEAITKVADRLLSEDENNALKALYEEKGIEAVLTEVETRFPGTTDGLQNIQPKLNLVDPPSPLISELKALLKSKTLIDYKGAEVPLDGVLHIKEVDGKLSIDYWSSNINSYELKSLARKYFNERSTRTYLESGGLTPEGLDEARRSGLTIQSFNPNKVADGKGGGQAVTLTDRIPYLVSVIMAMMLWLTVFSGAYMLLTSMLEEKLNKLLEMMLATTRLSEIILGKLIGVAALTIAAMLPYILLGSGAAVLATIMGGSEVQEGLRQAFSLKMMIFFPIFLFLGYIFYGSLFIATGAMAESMQDAQTLTTPIMLVLTACIMVVPLGINAPDSPLLGFASWFPLSAPFATIARLPQDPPWWELTLSAAFLALMSVAVIWLAGRMFRYGVLSGGGIKAIPAWFKRVVFRRKS